MKAKRKIDGKIIEVKPYYPPQEEYDSYKRYPFEDYYLTPDNEILSNYDLEFDVEEAEQTESAVIQGWVARDNGGFISLFSYCPDRVIKGNDGFWGHNDSSYEIDLPRDSFPSLTWESEPLEVEITLKPKKKCGADFIEKK